MNHEIITNELNENEKLLIDKWYYVKKKYKLNSDKLYYYIFHS
ncbi:hypothetical protein [uncultured Clostridium sp.]|nr:hypothetical protein [uncultured Clostridium sp.]